MKLYNIMFVTTYTAARMQSLSRTVHCPFPSRHNSNEPTRFFPLSEFHNPTWVPVVTTITVVFAYSYTVYFTRGNVCTFCIILFSLGFIALPQPQLPALSSLRVSKNI